LTARRIDLVIAVTPAQGAAWLARRYPRGRVVVVENGTEPVDVPESREAIREELEIPESAVVATLVATMRPEKRVADFVTAVRQARESDPNLIGVVVGDGPDRAAVHAAAGHDPGVRLRGHRKD